MMITSIVSKESLARDTHTQTDTQASRHTDFGLVYLKLFKVISDDRKISW